MKKITYWLYLGEEIVASYRGEPGLSDWWIKFTICESITHCIIHKRDSETVAEFRVRVQFSTVRTFEAVHEAA